MSADKIFDKVLHEGERVLYLKGGRAIEEATRLFPRLGELPDGGPDKFLLAVMFFCQRCKLVLCSFGPKNAARRISGKDVFEYSARPETGGRLTRRIAFLSAVTKFLRDTLALKPTIIVCGVDGPFALAALLAARFTRAKLVFSAHGALTLPTTSFSYRAANKIMCRGADFVITHGPYVRQEAISLGASPSKVAEFNNGLDEEHISLVEALPPKTQSGHSIVLYVGRIEIDKGVIDLLDAFVSAGQENTELHFVGSGAGVEVLRSKISLHNLLTRVFVHGPVPFEDVFLHFRRARIVVTPSRSSFPEGFCKSAMEAMFTGTPVIAPDYGPFPYLVKHGDNGLLYRADDVNDLATKIKQALSDNELLTRISSGAVSTGRLLMRPQVGFAKSISIALSQLGPRS